MLDFQPVKLEDQEHIDKDLTHAATKNYDECFAHTLLVEGHLPRRLRQDAGLPLLRLEEEGRPGFIPPVGAGDFTAAMRELMRSQKEKGEPLVHDQRDRREQGAPGGSLPGQFTFERRRISTTISI